MLKLAADLGIDLGTANIVIYSKGKGIVTREPAVVALDKTSGKVLKIGTQARMMLGRTPGNVVTIRPMKNGVVSDYDLTVRMLRELLGRLGKLQLVKPRVVVSVPSSITEMEERAVVQAALEAGARRAYLMEEPLAAALGAGLDLSGAAGKMIVDIGGGTTDIASLSMNGVVRSASLQVAGDAMDEAIVKYLRRTYQVLVGTQMAETIKMSIGGVFPRAEKLTMIAKGRDLKSGLPKELELDSAELEEVLKPLAQQMIDGVLSVLEDTPPELVTDISQNGIVLTGGGSRIWGMDRLLQRSTGIRCSVADDAESCVALGLGKALSWINTLQEGTLNLARKKLLDTD